MRFFKLLVDNREIAKLDQYNPTSLRIQFTINAYRNISQAVPSVISLWNVPLSMLSQASLYWKNKPIELHAGMLATSPLLQGALTNIIQLPIYRGKISNVLTNFDGQNTQMSFLCSGFDVEFNTAMQGKKALIFKIEKGQPIGSIMQTFLTDNMPNFTWVDATNNEAACVYQHKTLEQLPFKTFKSIIDWLKSFNIDISMEGNIGSIYWTNSDTGKTTLDVVQEAVQIEATDLLAQPRYESATQIQIELALSGRYRVGQLLRLPNNTISSIGSLMGSFTADSASLQGDPKSLIAGSYTSLQVVHTGDSSSTDASAWATTIMAATDTAIKKV